MKKILIVDDEVDILTVLEKKFRENNYFVMAVSSGKDAIQICKLNKPDLMLLDIAMPDMDGYDVVSVLRKDKSLENIPIIFLTGKELEYSGIEERLSEFGKVDIVMKPCSFQDLLAKVKGIIG